MRAPLLRVESARIDVPRMCGRLNRRWNTAEFYVYFMVRTTVFWTFHPPLLCHSEKSAMLG